MRLTRWLGAFGAVMLVACREPSRGANIQPDSSAGPVIDPASAPGQVTLALWQLRPGISLGEWAATRAGEQLEGYNREANRDYLGDWCARSATTVETGATTVQRVAYFYPPPQPPGAALPDDGANPDSLRAHCLLGLLATQTVVPDSVTGSRLNDSVASNLNRAFGRGEGTARVSFFGSAFWRRVGLWRRGDLVIVSALSGLPYPSEETSARWSVVTFAFLPVSGLAVDPERDQGDGLARAADTLPLEIAAKAVARDSTAWRTLRRVLEAATPSDESAEGTPPTEGLVPDSLVRALRRWIFAASVLPPKPRAAALYVADQVLDRTLCAYGLCGGRDGARLAPLKALGAKFTWSDQSRSWVYRRNWMYEARTLDRDSPVGQSIFLLQLAQGFDPSGACETSGEGIQRVLDNGERYLARVPNGPISSQVHFYLGEAYRDIAALADGAADSFADSATYQDRAPLARREALRHYRATMAGSSGTPAADLAWRRGWWILAELPMKGVRFLCVAD